MALTTEDRQRVLNMLDQADEEEKNMALQSERNFGRWLENNLNQIFQKIKNYLSNLWQSIKNFFS